MLDALRGKRHNVAHALQSPDEALDPLVAALTMELLDAHLSERGQAMLLFTHDLGYAAQIAVLRHAAFASRNPPRNPSCGLGLLWPDDGSA